MPVKVFIPIRLLRTKMNNFFAPGVDLDEAEGNIKFNSHATNLLNNEHKNFIFFINLRKRRQHLNVIRNINFLSCK